jgi:hypothetical protein
MRKNDRLGACQSMCHSQPAKPKQRSATGWAPPSRLRNRTYRRAMETAVTHFAEDCLCLVVRSIVRRCRSVECPTTYSASGAEVRVGGGGRSRKERATARGQQTYRAVRPQTVGQGARPHAWIAVARIAEERSLDSPRVVSSNARLSGVSAGRRAVGVAPKALMNRRIQCSARLLDTRSPDPDTSKNCREITS